MLFERPPLGQPAGSLAFQRRRLFFCGVWMLSVSGLGLESHERENERDEQNWWQLRLFDADLASLRVGGVGALLAATALENVAFECAEFRFC